MKCLRSVEGILNFTISVSSAEFAALSASMFPCIAIWLRIQESLILNPHSFFYWFVYITCKNMKVVLSYREVAFPHINFLFSSDLRKNGFV